MIPYGLTRAALFKLDPETAHNVAMAALTKMSRLHLTGLVAKRVHAPCEVLGLKFDNAVGLAAGLDKNGAYIDALAALGFGFIEVGTVTPKAQPGNSQPRMFRLTEHEALINRLGFNNGGLDAFLANVQKAKYKGVLGLNIGKNATTPIENAADDYLTCLRGVYPHASYVTVPTPKACAIYKPLASLKICYPCSKPSKKYWPKRTNATCPCC
jgi:dihydroorotate dehydrogenase